MPCSAALPAAPSTLTKDSGWLLGKIVAGTETYIQNWASSWAAILVPLIVAAWFGMNNLMPLSPNYGGAHRAFGKILYLWGLTSIVGGGRSTCTFPLLRALGLLNMWVALPLTIVVVTVLLMKLAPRLAGMGWHCQTVLLSFRTSTRGR